MISLSTGKDAVEFSSNESTLKGPCVTNLGLMMVANSNLCLEVVEYVEECMVS